MASLRAQTYQLPNNGFEQWDGTALDAEPTHWNSFATSDGTYASMASSPHHYHRNGHHTGGDGNAFLTIYTKSIIGVKANGKMTTGRIHAGAMSASSSNNYNYTQRANSDHSCPFTATPDSMYVWVSFYASSATSRGGVTAYIHGDNDFQDPNDWDSPTLYKGYAKARFTRTTTSPSAYGWQLVKVPFVYDGTSTANYILVSLTTNETPGSGSANDSLSIDDILFVYSSWLTSITLNGAPLEGFEQGRLAYEVEGGDATAFHGLSIGYTTEVSDATVTLDSVDGPDGRTYTLHVVAEDGATAHDVSIRVSLTPAPNSVFVDVQSDNPDYGTVSGGGHYLEGDTVLLTATPLSGYLFAQWTDGDTLAQRTIIALTDTLFIAHFIPDPAVGILSPNGDMHLTAYPNPARESLTVALTTTALPLELYDLRGRRRLLIQPTDTLLTLTLADHPSGTYILRQGTQSLHIVRQ